MRGLTAKLNKYSGFTLVELLVVISIIAVLATIIFINYQTVVKKGRDAKRQSDLKTLQSAAQNYYSDKFSYPSNLNQLTGPKVYLKVIPTDPLTTNPQYNYTALPNNCTGSANSGAGEIACTDYCLYTKLEALTPTSPPPSPPPGCTSIANYNFIVTRP